MVTNVVIDASKITEPEDMNANMKLVILADGSTKFVNLNEEYQLEGLQVIGFQG